MIWIKSLIFTIFLPGVVIILFPYLILHSLDIHFHGPNRLWDVVGMTAIVSGSMAYFWTVSDFVRLGKGTPAPIDPPRKLVCNGLYRYSRNPMYVGVLSILTGEALLFESGLVLVYACLVFALFHSFVVRYEEPVLRSRFGEAYDDYCKTVPRWLPGLLKRKKHL